MMHPYTAQALGQARLADLHHQARHAALARAVRLSRHRAQRQALSGPARPGHRPGQGARAGRAFRNGAGT